jgi:hypothetical protein
MSPIAAEAGPPPVHEAREDSGLAHVATASFLAARAAPSVGFWVALAGGVALARAGARRGMRTGYGASVAAMLQTVAIIGPARFAVPLTQALSAPLLGAMEARGRAVALQLLACSAIRLVHNAVTAAFAILVLTGGLDAYTATYDSIVSRLGFLPEGTGPALVLTAVSLVVWTVFASVVQVHVYRRGLRTWPDSGNAAPSEPAEPEVDAATARSYDPRAVAIAAAVAFVALVASTSWIVLGAVAVWLAVAGLTCRGDGSVVATGAALAVLLGAGVLVFSLVGGFGLDVALARASRAGLLVLVATWLRAAAGSVGLREVSRRGLGRLRRVPSMKEAAQVMDELGSGRQLVPAGREVVVALRAAETRPLPVLDAVLGWVGAEAGRFRPAPPSAPMHLRARLRDAALVLAAAAPLAVLLG